MNPLHGLHCTNETCRELSRARPNARQILRRERKSRHWVARARRSIRNGASSNQGCRHLRVSLMDAVARHRRSQSVDVFVGDGTSSDARSRKGSCVTLCDSLSVDCSRTRRGLTASPLPHVSIPRPEVPAARVVHRPSLHLTYNVGHLNFAIKFIHLSTSHFMMLPILNSTLTSEPIPCQKHGLLLQRPPLLRDINGL